MKQIAVQIRNSSNAAVTGLTSSNFAVRTSPYTSAEDISGLTVTEVGVQGNYVISGFTTWYENIKVFVDTTGSFVEQTWIGVQDAGDLTQAFVTLSGTQTITGAKTFSSVVACSTAATSSTHLMRYNETVRTSGSQTVAGIKVFSDLPQTQSTRTYSSDRQLVDKEYVDDTFAGAVGVVQSTQEIQCIPTRTTNDHYSQATLGGCVSQLDTSSSKRGCVTIPHTNEAGNTITLADDETWFGARIDIVGTGKPKIDLTASSANSLTYDMRLTNVYLYSSASTNFTFVNFTFENCIIYVAGDLTLTTCVFKGTNAIRLGNTKTLTIANSTGYGAVVYNDDIATVSITGTQCSEIKSMNVSNMGV